MANPIESMMRRIDAFQQRHRMLAFPFAVSKKFGDDQGGYLAALIAYYGFFSLFPLLLVFVSLLGLLLPKNPALQQDVVNSALRNFPVVGPEISRNIHSIRGNGIVLAIGLIGTLWAGLGVTQAAQYAMNEIWDVRMKHRPNFLWSRLRGLLLLAVLGTFTVLAALASGIGGSGAVLWLRIAAVTVAFVLNTALFLVAFRVLTRVNLSWVEVFPGG